MAVRWLYRLAPGTMGSVELDGTETIMLVGVVLSALSSLLVVYVIYKIRQIHETLYGTDYLVKKLSHSVSQSLQYLELLAHELEFGRPLPPLRNWAASPDLLLMLVRHIRRFKPNVILECGSGASTVVLAQAAKLNGQGRVYSIDHNADFADQTRDMLEEYGVSDWAEVHHAPLRWMDIVGTQWEWYDLESLPNTAPIDLLFIDGPPGDTPKPLARYPAGPILFPRLSPHGVLFADDTDRPGETEILQRWSMEFPHLTQHRHFCEKGCHELRPERRPEEETSLLTRDVATPRQRISSS